MLAWAVCVRGRLAWWQRRAVRPAGILSAWWSSCLGLVGLGLRVRETVGLGASLDDVAAEGEPVHDRGAEPRIGGSFPGVAEVGGSFAKEAELGVSSDHEPSPAVGSRRGPKLGAGPAEGLFDHSEGVLQVEAADKCLPADIDGVAAEAVGRSAQQSGSGSFPPGPGAGQSSAVTPARPRPAHPAHAVRPTAARRVVGRA